MPPVIPNTLTNGTVADATQVMANLNAINAGVAPVAVSVLPGSPYDGQEIHYIADGTNGVIWHLKYRAGSGSAYKWEYVGGSVMRADVQTEQGTGTVNTWLDLATVGPSVTVPLAGDYEVQWGCFSSWDGASGAGLQGVTAMGIQRAGTDPAAGDRDPWTVVHRNNNGNEWDTQSRSQLATGLSASSLLKARYRINQNNGNWGSRWLTVRPVRVG